MEDGRCNLILLLQMHSPDMHALAFGKLGGRPMPHEATRCRLFLVMQATRPFAFWVALMPFLVHLIRGLLSAHAIVVGLPA